MDKIEITKYELREILREFNEDQYDSCTLHVNSVVDKIFNNFKEKILKCSKCKSEDNLVQSWNQVHPNVANKLPWKHFIYFLK